MSLKVYMHFSIKLWKFYSTSCPSSPNKTHFKGHQYSQRNGAAFSYCTRKHISNINKLAATISLLGKRSSLIT